MLLRLIFFFAFIGFINGCSILPPAGVKPEAESIKVTILPPNQNCKYKGTVYGSQGNWLTGLFTSNLNLLKGSRNRLKNHAQKVNANYVLLQQTRYEGNATGALFLEGLSNSTLAGGAYQCPSI